MITSAKYLGLAVVP